MTRTLVPMWHVSSKNEPGRWVEHDGTNWTADRDTTEAMEEYAGQPVDIAPMGDLYTPTGSDDPTGLYLLARRFLPGPLVVTGTPPQVPVAEQYADGTVH